VIAATLVFAVAVQANRNLYVSGFGSSTVAGYDFAASGGLSPVPGSPFASSMNASPTAITPDGRHLYVAGAGGAGFVSAYDVAASGTLTPVAGSPFTSSGAQGLAATADGRHLYVANIGTADTVSAFDIAPGGGLAPLGSAPAGDNPSILIATPDSRHLYATNIGAGSNTISMYEISANGTLVPIGTPVPAGSSPRGGAVTPDGRHLYVSNQGSGNIYAFDIAANGTLGAVPGSPFTVTGTSQFGVAITPDGRHVFVASYDTDSVFAFDIAPDGALTPVPGSPFGNAGTNPIALALTPGGRRLYVAAQTSTIAGFEVAANGALTPIAGSPFPAGVTGPDLQSLSITPDQGPSAAFLLSAAAPGSATQFDGKQSSDPGGTVASFAWNFGDGTTASGASPSASHVYAKAGVYTATLTVTDNEGCSSVQIFTGQSVSCNGGGAAVTSAKVDTPPALTGLRATNRRFAVASARRKRVKRGTRFRYRLSEAARVTFTIRRKKSGRRVGKACKPKTRKNRKRRKCVRLVRVGSFSKSAKAGLNRTRFTGRIRGRKLKRGSYKVIAVARDSAGGKSRPRSASFKIVRRTR
jgi:DNA-binding beta-propeller fold protein YncE